MLQEMRDKTQGIVAKIIIGFIVFMFAVWGIESLVSGSHVVEVAKVNGEKITEPQLLRAIDQQKRQLVDMMRGNVQPELLDDDKLRGPALENLIEQRMLIQSAKALKLDVSNRMVDQAILGMEAFKDNGQFSAERYQTLLSQQGYTPVYFKEMLQQGLVLNQLQSGLADSEFATPAELDNVAKLLQQQRSFRYLTIPTAALAEKVQLSDADIQAYYQQRQDQFMREERVKLEYIELRASDFFKPVEEAELRAEYDRMMAEFKPTTERHAAHILIEVNANRPEPQAKALADAIAQKLAAGEPFDKLAQQYSDDLGSKGVGGDLGYSGGNAFPPAFESALATLKVGQVSTPVKSESGYHLIKLLDEQVKAKPTFEEQKAEIAKRLQETNAQPELLKSVEKLRDIAFNAEGLQEPAKELKLNLRESDWIDRATVDPVLSNAKVLAAAFSEKVLKEHYNSDVLELAPDHFLVLSVKQHEPPTPKPLEQVRDAIVTRLKQERGEEQGRQLAQQLVAQLRQGGDLQQLAAQHGYQASTIDKSPRNNPQVGPELLREVFGMPRPSGQQSSIDVIGISDGNVAVVQLLAVEEGKTDSFNAAQRNALATQLRQSYGRVSIAGYVENVRARAEIEKR